MIATDELVTPLPQKSNKKLRVIVGAVIGIVAFCLAVGAAAAVFGAGKVAMEKPLVETVLDSFMKSMAAKDSQKAYTLFSPRAQRQFPVTQLDGMTEGNNFALFEGYQSLSAESLEMSATVNSDPKLPQGTVATVTGVISYDGGFQGRFDGILEKVDGKWRIYTTNVTVPPNKIRP